MRWSLGLAAWVIQDGNYGDFERGQEIEVAIEFVFDHCARSKRMDLGAQCVDGCTYDLTGRVVLADQNIWILDAGILMFQNSTPPKGVSVGDIVAGQAYVGVDPFFYFESLAQTDSMPPLIYTWRVARIARQTGPLIQVGNLRQRNTSKSRWEDIERTDAWNDDERFAEYILDCELRDVPRKRTSATASCP